MKEGRSLRWVFFGLGGLVRCTQSTDKERRKTQREDKTRRERSERRKNQKKKKKEEEEEEKICEETTLNDLSNVFVVLHSIIVFSSLHLLKTAFKDGQLVLLAFR